MITYCVILSVLNVILVAAADEGKDRFALVVSSLIYLPIFGRIFGWW